VDDGSETEEEIQAAYLIGADGAKGYSPPSKLKKRSTNIIIK